MLKAFKKTLEEGVFTFVIGMISYYGAMKTTNFLVCIVQLPCLYSLGYVIPSE